MNSMYSSNGRVRILVPFEIHSHFRDDVAAGLSRPQKSIAPKYFYDHAGSLLFEHICQQPEYYLTRTETAILTEHATDIIEAVGECTIVELGSGSAVKTRLLLTECQRRGHQLHYIPIDIGESMLRETAGNLVADYPLLQIDALATDYENGLAALPVAQRRLVLFFGSNLGNFTESEQRQLLTSLASSLQTGDYFLLGLDLRKSATILEPAYNDDAGVTAAFNRNLLRRMNRELGADLDLASFAHVAFYNQPLSQIEMHLQSTRAQEVIINDLALRVQFHAGETMQTEISRKFDAAEIRAHLQPYGFEHRARWTDARGWFLVSLFQFIGATSG